MDFDVRKLAAEANRYLGHQHVGEPGAARSTGLALFIGGWALAQLWLFWVAPLVGGAVGGLLSRWLGEEPSGAVTGRRAVG